MNFADLDDDQDYEQKVLMMDTYERLLRLRNILETDTFQPKAVEEYTQLKQMKKEYLELLEEVLLGWARLQPKKDKANTLLSFVEKFGNSDYKYVQGINALIEQFDKDEGITELAAELKEKTEKLLGLKKVFELCTEADVASRYICFLCLDRTIDTFIDPCGHVICDHCSQRSLTLCPFCRTRIHTTRKMYLS